MALQSRAPLVPMVIGNASRLLPVGSLCCRSDEVAVRMLPPIFSLEYRADNLREEAVRLTAIYERELALLAPPATDRSQDAAKGAGGSK
jgi:1-acyl-sn-glycerol-3-phosphate acyltransferase